MPERVRIDEAAGLPDGAQKVYTVAGRRVAVFNIGGTLHAIDDACPHRGDSLSKGPRDGLTVTCPRHGWAFDLATGACHNQPGVRVPRYEVFRQGESLILDVTPPDDAPATDDGIYRYLVRYSVMGWVGRFGSIDRIPCARGDAVLIHTRRGLEIGEILAEPTDSGRADPGKPAGEVVRCLSADEVEQTRLRMPPTEILERGHARMTAAGLPAELLDAEWLFDGQTVVLYYLAGPETALDSLAADLEAETGTRVLLEPLIDAPAAGCGSGGCGCHAGESQG